MTTRIIAANVQFWRGGVTFRWQTSGNVPRSRFCANMPKAKKSESMRCRPSTTADSIATVKLHSLLTTNRLCILHLKPIKCRRASLFEYSNIQIEILCISYLNTPPRSQMYLKPTHEYKPRPKETGNVRNKHLK